jgi:eukaryotic-like serine/threonine-protein kinase
VADSADEPTLVDHSPPISTARPPAPTEPPPSVDASASSLTHTIVLVEEQATKQKALLRMGLIGGVAATVALQVPAPAPGHWAATAGAAVVTILCALALVFWHPSPEVQTRRIFAISICVQIAVLVGLYHMGVFSPIGTILIFGVYFFGLSDTHFQAWTIFLIVVVGYALLGGLATAGVIDISKAVFPVAARQPASDATLTAFLVLIMSLTFWLARVSRRATIRAMTELEQARQQIHRGRALLHEARADLHLALQAPGMGRLSGQNLGPYRIATVIGRGAAGEVYAATDTRDGRDVAVKALYPHAGENEASYRRFVREAEICGSLESQHIVRVLDDGVAPDGSPFLVMERLFGHDLAWHLRSAKRFGTRRIIELVGQVAEALGKAQDAGVVHRDLKPQNLFAEEHDGMRTWKVLDFGVSKIEASQSSLTQDAIIGTPSYMAPEQVRGDAVDHRADVFALGVIVYRALSGKPAFTGADTFATLYNVAYVQPARPSDHANLHPDVDLVLALALAKDKQRRFASAPSLAAALRDALRGELDARLKQDALQLLSREPWGTDLGGNAPRPALRSMRLRAESAGF